MQGEPVAEAPTLIGSNVTLRRPVPADLEARLAFGRDPYFHRMVGGDPSRSARPFTRADGERWLDRVTSQPLAWCIERDGRLVGSTSLHMLDNRNLSARFTIGIFSTDDRGRGIGTQATRLVLAFAFDELHLHRVDLRVLEFNTVAIRTYERCGFVREGVERHSALIAGGWYDDVRMSILEPEFRLIASL